MSMKFDKTIGTEGILKLTKFGVATLIFRDTWLPTIYWEATKYGNLLRRRHLCKETLGRWCIGY